MEHARLRDSLSVPDSSIVTCHFETNMTER
jgi:hypothetical protein